jgi:hypothetical protein
VYPIFGGMEDESKKAEGTMVAILPSADVTVYPDRNIRLLALALVSRRGRASTLLSLKQP